METIEIDQTCLRMDSQGFYELDIPEKLNMARLMVDFRAEHGRAQDVAIYDEDRKITYQELKDLTDRFAKGGR
jgi:acyl-coenzyme A synthetase/AMP-(fatty) acid ligase